MAEYATATDVEARLVGFPATVVPFSADTEPTLTQVQAWLDDGETTLNGSLHGAGLPAPYTGGDAKTILGEILTDLVEGRVRNVISGARGSPDRDGDKLIERFHAVCKDFLKTKEFWAGVLGAGPQSSERRAHGYVLDNNDGKSISAGDFEPWVDIDEKF